MSNTYTNSTGLLLLWLVYSLSRVLVIPMKTYTCEHNPLKVIGSLCVSQVSGEIEGEKDPK
jgi:hypothetical protein